MICPNCGRETAGKFCPFCGSKLAAEPEVPQQPASVSAQPQEPAPIYTQPQEPAPVYTQPQVPTPAYTQPQEPAPAYTQPQEPYPVYSQPQNREDVTREPPMAGRVFPGVPVGDGAVGRSQASQLLRKLASSPIFLLAALLFTLSVLFPGYLNVKNLLENIRVLSSGSGSLKVDVLANVIGGAGIVLLNLLTVLGLWAVFFSADRKSREQMGTGGLSILSAVTAVTLMVLSLLAGLTVMLLVQNNASDNYSSLFRKTVYWINDTLHELGVVFPNMDVSPLGYRNILLGAVLAALLLAIVYYGRTLRSIGTAKHVIRTGGADDRVSVFVALVTALLAVFSVYRAVRYFTKGNETLEATLMGISLCLSAVAGLSFAVLLFRFRSGMRKLGVRRGIPV